MSVTRLNNNAFNKGNKIIFDQHRYVSDNVS